MAETARHPLIRTVLRGLKALGLALALVIALFLLSAWIGSSLPRNHDWLQPDQGVEILVETNGIHTALILPTVTPAKDWHRDFPLADIADPHRPYTHVAISWGEREVFLNTPTWADLSPATATRVVGLGGEGLLHVAHYIRPAASADARPLRLREEEYRRLVRALEAQLGDRWPAGHHAGYGRYDVFYETGGRYTVLRTCNQWTSDMLAQAGVRIGRWTPFAGGVMKWVPQP